MSIQDLGEIGWNLPVWGYIVLCRFCGLLGSVMLTVIATGVSTVTGQNLKSVMILFVVLLAPYLLSGFGMTLFDVVNIKHLLYPILPDNTIHYILYASAVVILYAVGARKWNGRRRK